MNKLIFGLAIALAACGGKKDEKKPEGSGSSMAGNGSSMAGNGSSMAGNGSSMAGNGSAMAGNGSGAAAGSAVDVPTETDFEADEKAKITDKNVTGELDQLEKDLGP